MNEELGIKLQAYLDGELGVREARSIAALIERDADVRALHAELQQTRAMLVTNEPEIRLPESREFYWSKIEREIQRLEASSASRPSGWMAFLRRYTTALAGTSVAAALVLFVGFQMGWLSPNHPFDDTDNPFDDTPSFSFRSEAQKMTLVWIATPADDAAEEMPEAAEDIQ